VSWNNIHDPKSFRLIEHAISKYSQLSRLSLSYNPLGAPCIKSFMASIKEPNSLSYLNLTSCSLNSTASNYVWTTLDKCQTLKELIMDKNDLKGFNSKAVLKFLRTQKSIEILSLKRCNLGPELANNL